MPATEPGRRNQIGNISLIVSIAGAIGARVAASWGGLGHPPWLHLVTAGFDAALVGGLADWFAVTALFRHPLGLPIPHTAIIPKRRAKMIEGIANMVQEEWLSPEVIGSRLERLSPSQLIVDWLQDPEHVERLGGPLRDIVRQLAGVLVEPEIAELLERAAQRQLRHVPIDDRAGRWIVRIAEGEAAKAAFASAAQSLANLARQPATAEALQAWLERAAIELRKDGKRLVPLLLRRKVVQRTLVEAACDYASRELAGAVAESEHPMRVWVFGLVRRFGEQLAAGDARAVDHLRQLRDAVAESIEVRPVVVQLLRQARDQLIADLSDPASYLSQLIDRKLHAGILDALADGERRARFDRWIQGVTQDLLRRHRDQIGLTVRENLEALDTATLVAQIEARVGNDLQFIRLNGALVGGLIGILIAALQTFVP